MAFTELPDIESLEPDKHDKMAQENKPKNEPKDEPKSRREAYADNENALFAFDMGYKGGVTLEEVQLTAGVEKDLKKPYEDGVAQREAEQKQDETATAEGENVSDSNTVAEADVVVAEEKVDTAVGNVLANEKVYHEASEKTGALSTLSDPLAVIDRLGIDHPLVEKSFTLLFEKNPNAVFDHLDLLKDQPYSRTLFYRACRASYENDSSLFLAKVCANDPDRRKITHSIDRFVNDAINDMVSNKPYQFKEDILGSPNARKLLGDDYDKWVKQCDRNIKLRRRKWGLLR